MRLLSAMLWAAMALGPTSEPAKKRRPLPYEYGRVVIDNSSEKAGLPAVVFDHWLHRAKYTCRLCHVDLGFAMKASATGVKAQDNEKGFYCGACHDGRMSSSEGKLFASCDKSQRHESRPACLRCHSQGQASHRLLRLHPRLAPRPVRKRRRLGEGGGSGPHPPARLPRRRLHPQKAARGPGRFRALAQGRGHARDHLLAPQAHGLERLRAVPSGNFRRREEGRDALHDGGELRGAVLRRLPQHGGLPMLDCQRCHTGPVQ